MIAKIQNYENNQEKTIIKKSKRKSIKELFENYKENYKTNETDWGETKGKEIW